MPILGHSLRARWLAQESIHGPRLREIARKHSRLASEAGNAPQWRRMEIAQEIHALRKERDEILDKYEKVVEGSTAT